MIKTLLKFGSVNQKCYICSANQKEKIMKVNVNVRKSDIRKAEQVLIDNGIEADEAAVVLQAIGYVLLNTELYPEED